MAALHPAKRTPKDATDGRPSDKTSSEHPAIDQNAHSYQEQQPAGGSEAQFIHGNVSKESKAALRTTLSSEPPKINAKAIGARTMEGGLGR